MGKGALIGRGMTAEVYESGDRQVLKLYYEWYKPEWIREEAEIAAAVQEAGVPAPKIYGMKQEDGRNGLLCEKVEGPSMLAEIQSTPFRMRQFAKEMARLHLRIHRCGADKLPRQKDRLEHAIQASADILGERTEGILRFLRSLPQGTRICHGDFHPDNILVADGGSIAIDWTNASLGDPMGDVARTSLMFLSPFNPPGTPKAMSPVNRLAKKLLNRAYLNEYRKLGKLDMEALGRWMLPVAAARLTENVPGEREWLMERIDSRLRRL
ncbi:phosphotransferase [Cohnella caldifontis]|uniref:phosphotransferase n=1 Tax=Cohnella caldifontis TaxID=3027471 RepID=UPI0023EDEECD|nr:phosphotransferase [Cohnella sp. YIM B05605]